MQLWQDKLPLSIETVWYEELVSAPGEVIAKLADQSNRDLGSLDAPSMKHLKESLKHAADVGLLDSQRRHMTSLSSDAP